MKVKRILFLMLMGIMCLTMSAFGVKMHSKSAIAATEATGFDINAEFLVLGETATAIKYASIDEFNAASETTEVAIDDQTMHLWLSETTIYYYAGDTEVRMAIVLPEDSSYLFSSLENVREIDLSGFMFLDNSNLEGLFLNCSKLETIDMSDIVVDSAKTSLILDGCLSLSEITLGGGSECLFVPAKTLWGDATIYDKDTGEVISSVPEIADGEKLTITKVAPVKTSFDFRDGNGFIESNAANFSYNPTKTGFDFAGWSKVIDDASASSLVDKTGGSNDSSYDAEDFEAGLKYYAVWMVDGKIVISQQLNLSSATTLNANDTYGYEWNSETKILTINGLNIENNNANGKGVVLPDDSTIVVVSGSENNISAKGEAVSCACLEIKTSESATGTLNLSSAKALVSSDSVLVTSGTITTENSIEVAGKFEMLGGDITISCVSDAPITANTIEIVGGKLTAESQWNNVLSSTGNVVISGGNIKLSAGVDSDCIYSESGNVTISGGIIELTATNRAINASNILVENFVSLKVGADKASAEDAEVYNGEAYLLLKFHDFEVSVDGDKIIATCKNESCELTNKKIEIVISISDKTYDSSANAVSVLNKAAFESVLNKTLEIKYVGIESTVYEETSSAPTNAGNYKVTVSLDFKGTKYQIIKTFEIAKAGSSNVTVPTALELTFNGTAQPLINAGSVSGGGVLKYKLESGEYSTSIPTATNAAEYKVYYKFFGDENHADSAENFVTVTISPKIIEIIWQDNNFVYNGSVQTITAKYKDVLDTDISLNVSVNNEFRNVGSYTATVRFVDVDSNYALPTTATKTYNIVKAKVQKPVADTTKYVYNGEEQTYVIASSDYYQITGNKHTDAGIYVVFVKLNDTTNYEWADSTITDLSFEFVINKATMIGAKDKVGNSVNEVEIKSAIGGIHPNAVFEVELIKSNDTSSINVLDKMLRDNGKLTATQKVYYGVNLTLKIDGAVIQPNGKVVLNIKVPEVLKSKTFELYHIHTNIDGSKEISKQEYTQAETNGYISVELDNFSELVFVVDEPPIETFPVHWVFIGISGLFVVLFLLWFFVLKKNKYDIVSKIVVSLFEGVGVVMLCMFRSSNMLGYAIFNLVMFVAVDLFYMINTSKEKQPEQEKIET